MEKRKIKEDTAAAEIVVTRTINAPRKRVWEAWTDPAQVAKWWGPHGFTTTTKKMDLRPGGEWIHVMHGPDGADYPNHSVFTEIVPHERICYDHGSGAPSKPDKRFTWTFEDAGANATKITMRLAFDTVEARDATLKHGVVDGANQTLERMADHTALTGPDVFVITRVVDAPRELVFKVWTEREHLMKWFTPKGMKMKQGKMDFRPGGTFHYCMTTADGKEMWGKWTFRDITRPVRLTLINAFSDEKGGIGHHPFAPEWPKETLSQSQFDDEQGKTKVTIRWTPHTSATEAERKFFANGFASMNQGWSGTFEQLVEYLATLR